MGARGVRPRDTSALCDIGGSVVADGSLSLTASGRLLPSPSPRSRPALLLLLSFQNATFCTSYTPDSGPDDLARARAQAGSLLSKKLIVSGGAGHEGVSEGAAGADHARHRG